MATSTWQLLPLLFLLSITLVDRAQAASSTTPFYIVIGVCVVYVIIDVMLVVALVIWCWKTKPQSYDFTAKKHQPSEPIQQLQLQSKPDQCDGEESRYVEKVPLETIDETDFGPAPQTPDTNKPENSVTPLVTAVPPPIDIHEGTPPRLVIDSIEKKEEEDVFPETSFTPGNNKSFEERKEEGKKLRQNAKRTESETPLLHDNKSHNSSEDDEERDKNFLSSYSPSFHKRGSPSSRSHSPSPKPEDPSQDIKLISITSGITGAILPPESPPKDVPKEIQSLDVSTIGIGISDTSFNEGAQEVKPSPQHLELSMDTKNGGKSLTMSAKSSPAITPIKSLAGLKQEPLMSPGSAPLGSLSDGLNGSGLFDDFLVKNNLWEERHHSFSNQSSPTIARARPHLNNNHRSSFPNLFSASPQAGRSGLYDKPQATASASSTPVHQHPLKFQINKNNY